MHLLSPFSLNLPLYEHKKTSLVPTLVGFTHNCEQNALYKIMLFQPSILYP